MTSWLCTWGLMLLKVLGEWALFRLACRVLDHLDRQGEPASTHWSGVRVDA